MEPGTPLPQRSLPLTHKHANELFGLIVDTAPTGMLLVDAAGLIVLVNAKAEQIFGFTKQELLGRSIDVLMPERFRAQHAEQRGVFVRSPASRAMAGGRAVFGLHKDGSEFPVEVTLNPLSLSDGLYVLTALSPVAAPMPVAKPREERAELSHGISECHAIETRLRTTQYAVDQAADFIFIIGSDGYFRDVNASACRRLGYTKQELLTMSMMDIDPDFPPSAWEPFWIEFKKRKQLHLEARHRSKTGEIYPVEVIANYFVHDGQELDCAIVRDMTERRRGEQALRESEERFAKAFRASPYPVGITEVETGCCIDVNEACLDLFGYSREEVIGRTTLILGIWPKEEDRKRLIERLKSGGQVRNVEMGFRIKTGEERYILVSSDLVEMNGRPCLVTVGHDITERKRAEQALQEKDRLLVTAQAQAHLGSWTWDVQTGVITWSDENYRLFGYEPHSVQPSYEILSKAVHEHDRDRVLRMAQASVNAGTAYDVECRIVRPSGEIRYVHCRGELTRDAAGRLLCMAGTVLDITERKAGELALQSAYQRLAFHVENTPLAVIEWAPDWQLRYWPAQAQKMFGWMSEEVLGKHPQDWRFAFEEDRDAMTGMMNRLMRGGERRNVQRIRTYTKTGMVVHCMWYNSVVINEQGLVVWIMSLIQDLSEHVRLERQFQQAQKMEAIGRLAGGIAHDFNNLLTVINGYSDLILSKRLPVEGTETAIRQILGAGQRASTLTRQLLAFSQQQVLQPQIVNINDIISNLDRMLHRLIGENIHMTLSLNEAVGLIRADPGQIEQVVMNLVVNARDAMPDGGELSIHTQTVELDRAFLDAQAPMLLPGPYVLMEVRDSGLGMDEATMQLIFEPFFTTKGPGKGTGLGLATVHGIVQQSHGLITVSSRLRQGTSFYIYFPRVSEAVQTAPAVTPVQPVRQGTETILLVEDEPIVRAFSRQVLRDAGYTVLESGTAEEAVFLSNGYERTIHLLLSDMVLPGASGPLLREQLMAQRPAIAVLLMSGHIDRSEGAQAALSEGTAFLQKPFTREVLLQKVRDVLDASPNTDSFEQLSLLS